MIRARMLIAAAVMLALTLLVAPVGAREQGASSATFSYTGNCTDSFQYFTVPADVNWITVTAWGGAGGHNTHTGAGGLGGWVTAPVQVTPGEQLAISVGAWGNDHGGCGWAPGGNRGYAEGGDLVGRDGFGGGSASVLLRYDGPSSIVPLIVAGGGGGGGGHGSGNGGKGGASSATPAKGDSGHGTWGGGGGCGGCRAQRNGTPGGDEEAGAGGGGGGGGGGYPYSGSGGDGGGEGGGGGGGAGASWAAAGIGAQFGTSDRACPYPNGPSSCNGLVTIEWDTHPSKVTAAAGDGQQAPVGTVFAQRLSAKVVNAEGFAVEGATVTFALPQGGASATFTSGAATSASATTNADGIAVSPLLEANGSAGPWRATAGAAGASSATFRLTNAKAATVTHLSSSADPSVAGQPVTFRAQVSTGTAPFEDWSGTVQFLLDGAPLGSAVAVDATGVAVSAAARLGIGGSPVGAHDVEAIFSGDADHEGSRAPLLRQQVRQAATATAVTTAPNPATTGQTTTITAQVSAQAAAQTAPQGTVDVYISPSPGAAPTLLSADVGLDANGRASVVSPPLSDGAYDVVVRYDGTASFAPSSGGATQSVGAAATATLVTSSVNPAVHGEPFELTATVARAGAGAGPSGLVTFTAGRLTLCGPTPVVDDNDGDGDALARCAVPGGLAAKPTPITVRFSDPDGGYDPSTGTLTQQVVSAASATTVEATPAQGRFGAATVLRARVAAVAPGSGLPRGTVQFYADDLAVGLPVEVLRGVAESAPIGGLSVGTHRLSAVFEDDSDPLSMLPSRGAITYHVERAPTTLAITSEADPAPAGQPVVLTAHAQSDGDTGPVEGDVQFLVDGAALGGPVPLRDGVARSQPLDRLAPGAHTVVAELNGGIRFAPASASFRQAVAPAPPAPPLPPAPPTPGLPVTPAQRPAADLRTTRVEASGDGVVNVVLGCTAARGARCRGALTLTSATRLPARLLAGGTARGWRSAGVRLGDRRYSLPAGGLVALRLRLTSGARRVLAARGGLLLRARATQASGAAAATGSLRVLAAHAPALRIDPRALVADADGRLALRVRCAQAWARCRGTVALTGVRDGLPLSSAPVAVEGGAVRTVTLRLNAAGRRALAAAAGSLRVRSRALTTLPAGRPTRSQRELTVRAADDETASADAAAPEDDAAAADGTAAAALEERTR